MCDAPEKECERSADVDPSCLESESCSKLESLSSVKITNGKEMSVDVNPQMTLLSPETNVTMVTDLDIVTGDISDDSHDGDLFENGSNNTGTKESSPLDISTDDGDKVQTTCIQSEDKLSAINSENDTSKLPARKEMSVTQTLLDTIRDLEDRIGPTSGSIPNPSIHGSSQMIINGSPVSLSSFPYQLKLVYFGAPRCGASIIHNDWVLTAAHCVQGLTPIGLSVVSELGFTIPIQTIELHPGYIVGLNTSPNDIAVLKLAPHYQDLTSYAVAVADGTNDFTGNTCIISGYGLTGGYAPFRLRAAYVNVLSEWQCEYAWTIYNFLANHVCVQGRSFSGTGACYGDSGGPLICDGQLAGVASFGPYGCHFFGMVLRPSAYTRTSYYFDWIREKCDFCI